MTTFRFCQIALLTVCALMALAGCGHGYISYRMDKYRETSEVGLSERLQETLPAGTTVTILEGPDKEFNLEGAGLTFGSILSAGNWEFDLLSYFSMYDDFRIIMRAQNGSTTRDINALFSGTGYGIDLTAGYKVWLLKPYVGARLNRIDFMGNASSGMNASMIEFSIRSYYAVGGLRILIPTFEGQGISLRADYAQPFKAEDGIKASIISGHVGYEWGAPK